MSRLTFYLVLTICPLTCKTWDLKIYFLPKPCCDRPCSLLKAHIVSCYNDLIEYMLDSDDVLCTAEYLLHQHTSVLSVPPYLPQLYNMLHDFHMVSADVHTDVHTCTQTHFHAHTHCTVYMHRPQYGFQVLIT